MKTVETCLSPELFNLFDIRGKVVVVIDILRATSCITTALAHGVGGIIPMADLEECRKYKEKGLLIAGERDGKTVEGFDLGNSPFSYMEPSLKGRTIAFTTTNGTQAIAAAQQEAAEVVIGSFLNKTVLANYLREQPNNIFIFCAGWRGKISMEDTLFAGALLQLLRKGIEFGNDACRLALSAYVSSQDNLQDFLSDCTHYKRLQNFGLQADIDFCLTQDKYPILPHLVDGMLLPKSIS